MPPRTSWRVQYFSDVPQTSSTAAKFKNHKAMSCKLIDSSKEIWVAVPSKKCSYVCSTTDHVGARNHLMKTHGFSASDLGILGSETPESAPSPANVTATPKTTPGSVADLTAHVQNRTLQIKKYCEVVAVLRARIAYRGLSDVFFKKAFNPLLTPDSLVTVRDALFLEMKKRAQEILVGVNATLACDGASKLKRKMIGFHVEAFQGIGQNRQRISIFEKAVQARVALETDKYAPIICEVARSVEQSYGCRVVSLVGDNENKQISAQRVAAQTLQSPMKPLVLTLRDPSHGVQSLVKVVINCEPARSAKTFLEEILNYFKHQERRAEASPSASAPAAPAESSASENEADLSSSSDSEPSDSSDSD